MPETNPDAAAQKREQQREYQRQWYLKNREKVLERARQRRADPAKHARDREYQRKWTQENREKVRESKRRWRAANPDRIKGQQFRSRDYQRKYYEANRSKWREQGRARKHGMSIVTFVAMWQAQQRKCYLCGLDLDQDDAVVDHWHGCPAHDPEVSCRACWRGLTHGECNTAIGLLGEDPDRLRQIADSLEAANREVSARQAPVWQQLTLE